MLKNENDQPEFRLGIDIGGTFTDFVIFNPRTGDISTFKLPSTPHDPSNAILTGLERFRKQFLQDIENSSLTSSEHPRVHIIHGSTVATNALLERKGAKTALITTRGFKDVIQIGRQNRPKLYDFATLPPEPLVPSELRFELDERVDQFGKIIKRLKVEELDDLIAYLQSSNPSLESISVVFLFSFANPSHEQIVAEKLRNHGYFVSASHEILPEYREYERTSTTVVNAYVSPILDSYLKKLMTGLNENMSDNSSIEKPEHEMTISNLQIMQSNGGSISVSEARKSGVRCILSGPAGGVVGCQYIAKTAQHSGDSVNQQNSPGTAKFEQSAPSSSLKILTFDMGGTSTDVSLIDGQPQITSEAEVGELPIRIPVLDIHTIGAGGGSIATIDAGGILRVGPESAGANPGPACYGRVFSENSYRGKRNDLSNDQDLLATVTDANLLLGRIPADRFLGGEMPLFPDLAEAAISPLAEKLGLSSIETALGIIEIANAHMERALRVISVERGYDPRQFTLLSFGGAGSLHAAELARSLGIPRLLIPPYAATLSAFGMLAANVIKDYTQTVMLPGNTPFFQLKSQITNLMDRAKMDIRAEGFSNENNRLDAAMDMRYQGQSYELTIPFTENFAADFHEHHRQTYGYLRPNANLEIVNLRVRGTGLVERPQISAKPLISDDPTPSLNEYRTVVLGKNQIEDIPFYQGESLKPGNIITGPAVVLRADTTILIGKADKVSVDPYLNLIVDIHR